MKYNLEDIKVYLENNLSRERYAHSIRVAEEAKELAKYYGVNEENTYIAGLLHDIAKEYDRDLNKYWIDKYNLDKSLLDSSNSKICHALVGSVVAKELFGVSEDIARAIKYHTIGNINMTLLDKIIFVADKIENGKDYPGIDEERRLAYKDIDKALLKCIQNSKVVLENKGRCLHEDTVKLLQNLQAKFRD